MKRVILIRGLPGSGKSTLAAQLALGGYDFEHIETDMYFKLGDDGEYRFDASKLPEAHRWAQDWAEITLKRGNNPIVSNTFSRVWEMQPYIDLAEKYDAMLTVIECQGDYGNVHNVSEEVVEKMRKRWEPYPRR